MSFSPANVQDTHEILALTIEANVSADQSLPDRWAAAFTDDGIFNSSLNGIFQGKDSLVAFSTEFTGRVKGRHFTANNVIEVDGDRARQQCYLMFTIGGQVATVGQYTDELVRVNGQWKFAHRIFVHDKRPK